jgi:hypothetical protein
MPYFTPEDVDVDVDDFMYQCNNHEIKEVIEYLIDNDYISEDQLKTNGELSLAEWEFDKVITKITDNRLRLTPEEDTLLRKIADRF